MQPYNYQIDVQQPFQSVLQGYQSGAAIRAMQMQQEQQAAAAQAAEAKRQADMQMQSELMDLSRNKSATAADYAAVSTRYPQLSEQLKRSADMMTGDQQRAFLEENYPVLAALENDRPEVAERIVRDRAAAMRNSGAEDQAKQDEVLAEMIKRSPDIARSSVVYRFSAIPGGDKVIDSIVKLGAESRAAAKAPAELRKAEADADKAGSDAATAGVEAKYAEESVKADLLKRAADTGLTKQQTSLALAQTKKYNADTKNALAEARAGNPAKQFDAETKLRSEYIKSIGTSLDTREAYRRVEASKDNAVGDLSLIFGYMRMLDPETGVREGEFANAENAAGVPERITNLYNKVVRGERLTANQRKSFIEQAGELNIVAERRMSEERKRLSPVIKAYSLDERNVFGEQQPQSADKPPAVEATATNPATGEKLVLRGGKWIPVK